MNNEGICLRNNVYMYFYIINPLGSLLLDFLFISRLYLDDYLNIYDHFIMVISCILINVPYFS